MEEASADLVYRDGKSKHLSCDNGENSLLTKLQQLQKLSNDVLTELVLKEKESGSAEIGDLGGVDEEDSDSCSDEANEPNQKKPKRKENHQ